MKKPLIIACLSLFVGSCSSETSSRNKAESKSERTTKVDNDGSATESDGEDAVIACKLKTPELQERKLTVLESLRKQMIRKKALPDGYVFTFEGTDKMLDELYEFIKTERVCCGFFKLGLTVTGDSNEAQLTITGPEGAKEMIEAELEL